MTIQTQLLTADDLLRLPEDHLRHELVRGELRTMALRGAEHGDITAELGWWLGQYVRAHHLGKVYAAESGFLIATNTDTGRASDVALISKARLLTLPPRATDPGVLDAAP